MGTSTHSPNAYGMNPAYNANPMSMNNIDPYGAYQNSINKMLISAVRDR